MIQDWNTKRLMRQFEEAGFTSPDREIRVPDYDWKNGNPEEFYNLYVKHPHPVVLRGFMANTELLNELQWDKLLKKYGEEKVFLTKNGDDGVPGKLGEVSLLTKLISSPPPPSLLIYRLSSLLRIMLWFFRWTIRRCICTTQKCSSASTLSFGEPTL